MKLLLALAAVATITVPVAARPVAPTAVVVVRSADLDLASPAGRARLDRRIDRAAAEACGAASAVDLIWQNRVARCRDTAAGRAARQRAAVIAAARQSMEFATAAR